MPLTPFQKKIFSLLKANRNLESYIAGGTAINQKASSLRYSNDIDFFHDTDEAVQTAFEADRGVLLKNSYEFKSIISQRSFFRAVVSKDNESLKLDWARDTAFRFFPVIEDSELGYRLHDVDLAVNKCVALANRSEVRDALDIIELDKRVLSLAGCCWAACGKDPGFTPELLLNLIQRHATFSPDLLNAESLAKKVDPRKLKLDFMTLLDEAKNDLKELDPKDLGCVYINKKNLVVKNPSVSNTQKTLKHFGSIKGSWPQVVQ